MKQPHPGTAGAELRSASLLAPLSHDVQTLPPMRVLVKSREVEDPVNNWLHRPLAYGFVALTWRSGLSPNGVTLLALLVGLASAAIILVGTPTALVVGGLLLWTSSILDGADGILARATGKSSQFGRAFDGAADAIVALTTVAAVFAHLYSKTQDPLYLYLAVPVTYLTMMHVILYDFYKERYLRHTRLDNGGEGDNSAALRARLATLTAETTPWLTRMVFRWGLIPYTEMGERMARLTNPAASDDAKGLPPTAQTAANYRHHNQAPMQLWALISLCPHSYLLALSVMFDRIDLYFWFRLVGANALLVVAIFWQRRATRNHAIQAVSA
jgi:phosphatidylglycerophosphate synthase